MSRKTNVFEVCTSAECPSPYCKINTIYQLVQYLNDGKFQSRQKIAFKFAMVYYHS